MSGAILVGGLLTNTEAWVNVTKKDFEDLEYPVIILLRKVLSANGNLKKLFTQLKLRIILYHRLLCT